MIQPAYTKPSDISLIIPARNAGSTLDRCLTAIKTGQEQPLEIIVFDDGSQDETARIASRRGVKLIGSPVRVGTAAGRNRAAEIARGRVLLFIDADVIVHRDTVSNVAKILSDYLDADAVFGSYDDCPSAPGFFSQFKNLQHHFVHQSSDREGTTFWGACGAVRREAFDAIAGFDERMINIQDIEFGMRLRAAGHRILVAKDLLVQHMKPYTMKSWLRSDILARAIPWSLLILDRRSLRADLNLRWTDRLSGILASIAPLCLLVPLALAARGTLFLGFACALLALNWRFIRFLAQARGFLFATGGFLALWTYYVYSTLAFGASIILHGMGRGGRPFWWAKELSQAAPGESATAPAKPQNEPKGKPLEARR